MRTAPPAAPQIAVRKKFIGFRLVPLKVKALDQFAIQMGCRRSEAIRFLINEGLSKYGFFNFEQEYPYRNKKEVSMGSVSPTTQPDGHHQEDEEMEG